MRTAQVIQSGKHTIILSEDPEETEGAEAYTIDQLTIMLERVMDIITHLEETAASDEHPYTEAELFDMRFALAAAMALVAQQAQP